MCLDLTFAKLSLSDKNGILVKDKSSSFNSMVHLQHLMSIAKGLIDYLSTPWRDKSLFRIENAPLFTFVVRANNGYQGKRTSPRDSAR